MKELDITLKLKVSDDDIDCIMCSALEGGISYWCSAARVVGGKYLGEYASEQISRGGELVIVHEDGESILTPDNFMKGLKRYLERDASSVINGELDTCYIDSVAADCIVQYAIFDEIVYG